MERPKKKDPNIVKLLGWSHNEQVGRNQAIDDYTAWLEEKCGVDKIEKIILRTCFRVVPDKITQIARDETARDLYHTEEAATAIRNFILGGGE